VHCVLIYNPAAGRNRLRRAEQLRQIASALSGLGHRVEIAATSSAGSATNQTREAVLEGAAIVFACGGDGTVHEVLQGLVSETGVMSAALGIIPLGSANALARHLRISLNPLQAALQQIDRGTQTVPVGKISFDGQARYFAVMAGAGPDGALVYNLLTGNKSNLGRFAYYLHAARLFATRSFPAFEVEFTDVASDSTVTLEAVSVMAIRVDSLGGLFSGLVGSPARIQDTHLRLVMLGPPAWLSLPLWFITGWLHLHGLNRFLRSANVSRFSCRPFSSHTAHFQADGEWLGRIPFEVSLIPDALRILVPSRDLDLQSRTVTSRW